MSRINITCKGCGKAHSVLRTKEIPDTATSMGCNWCPDCDSEEEYQEWFNYEPVKEPEDPAQLKLFPEGGWITNEEAKLRDQFYAQIEEGVKERIKKDGQEMLRNLDENMEKHTRSVIENTPINLGDGILSQIEDSDIDDDDFDPCSDCDGHDACRDFGCAFKAGLGHLVKNDPPI